MGHSIISSWKCDRCGYTKCAKLHSPDDFENQKDFRVIETCLDGGYTLCDECYTNAIKYLTNQPLIQWGVRKEEEND